MFDQVFTRLAVSPSSAIRKASPQWRQYDLLEYVHGLPIKYLALAAFLCLSLSCTAGAAENANLFPSPVYVTLQKSGAVEVLPSGQILEHLPGAHYDAISPNGKYLLVSDADNPKAYLLNASTGDKLATFQIGATPQGVAIGPNSHLGLAISAGAGTATVIDLEKHQAIKTIDVGKGPHNAVFTADGKKAYVTLQGGNAVTVLDMQAMKKVGEFPVPGLKGPHNLDLSADGQILWIRGFVGQVAAVDTQTHKVLAVIPVGLGHAGIHVASSGYVFTGAIADHVVDVIDPESFKVIKKIDVGQGPHGITVSRNGNWVYTGVTGTDKVAIINAHTLKTVKQIAVKGKTPFFLSIAGSP